ncbi:MAG: sialate O-acetylesterase, partial [Prevotella sp.]|nr:sialate O-acetylesterase [Prevotella sp.]
MKSLRKILFALCLLTPLSLRAEVVLPSLLTDGMVLQRDVPNKLWGMASAGETVEVRFMAKTYTATAGADGAWSVVLPATKAGGPYEIDVAGRVIGDVLIGDVWLCAGQSNMELPVSRVTDMFADEIAAYENDRIRQVIVPKTFNFHAPQSDMPPAHWTPLTQENVMSFSALAYFFAKEMYARTGVPVGIINASWGGTPITSWMSEEALAGYPRYINEKRLYEDDGYLERIKQLEGENFARWDGVLHSSDPGLNASPAWFDPSYDDSDWQRTDMFSPAWGADDIGPIGGSHWLRKDVTLSADWADVPAVLRLGCIVDADSVYVNGVFVGSTGYMYPPRIYNIPAGVLREGTNNITVRIVSNGGKPGFVREKPYKLIRTTADGAADEVSLEGTWRYRTGAPMPPAPGMKFFCYEPVGLYNAMIAPLSGCALRGVVWYQGESNVGQRSEYAALLAGMIAGWRLTFGAPELPFFVVELADYLPREDTAGRLAWAQMRAAQAEGAALAGNAYLIKNDDLGEWNDIHPLDKKTLAGRIADAA